MTNEQQFFIRLLSDHIHGRKTAPCEGLNWAELAALAKSHQLGGVLYHQCAAFLPDDVRREFQTAYSAAVYYYAKRKRELQALEADFAQNGIPFFLVKGLAVAPYYPVPALRTMGDLDIVIRRGDRDRANDILLSRGFHLHSHFADREWQYFKQGVEYELHDRLIYEETVTDEAHKAFFNAFWPYVKDGALEASFHFLFLLSHLRKHLMNAGVGFRMFMDLALMSRNEPALDWTWIREKLDALGMTDFASVCFGLIRRWFAVSAPIAAEPDALFLEKATASILSNGVFGFDNEENTKNAAVNAARQGKHSRWEMLKGAFRYVFLPYDNMRASGHYPYLDGRPLLLPVAWIHRLLRGLKKIRRATRKIEQSFASSETISKRDDYLKQWGL